MDRLTGLIKKYHELAKSKTAQELETISNGWGMTVAQTPAKEIPKLPPCQYDLLHLPQID